MNKRQLKYYNIIKEVLEGKGMKLVSDYEKSTSNIKIECEKGHVFEIRADRYRENLKCKLCHKDGRKGPRPSREKLIELGRKTTIEAINSKGGELVSEYKTARVKVKVKCKNGHIFESYPSSIKRGYWCSQCPSIAQIRSAEKFEKMLKEKNGSCKTKYAKGTNRIKVRCADGHEFSTTARKVIQGYWCPQCANNCKIRAKERMMEIIERKEGTLLSKYKTSITTVKIRCKEGHIFDITPHSMYSGHSWCRKCAGCCPEEAAISLEKKVKEYGGTLLSEYVSAFKKVRIRCKEGHIFECTPHTIKSNGQFCSKCSESKGERATRLSLESHGIKYKKEKTILKSNKRSRPRYDFFLTDKNTLIEFDGKQHFEEIKHFHRTPKSFETKKKADIDKTTEALRQGYKLIRIDYTCINDVDDHIKKGMLCKSELYLSSNIYKSIFDQNLISKSNLA